MGLPQVAVQRCLRKLDAVEQSTRLGGLARSSVSSVAARSAATQA
jgi:enolase